MNDFVNKILKSPLERPIRYAYKMWTLFNERLLNIETGQSASGPGARQGLPDFRGIYTDHAVNKDNRDYVASDYHNIGRMMRILAPGRDDVFYDIGCGKGRILCVAARLRLKRVVGVELFEELCTVARHNAECLRGRKTPIDVICVDATKIDYSDGTVFMLYYPFGELTMRAVIKSIRESFYKNPRNIRIGYYESPCEHILAEESWLEKFASFRTVGGNEIGFWRNKSR